MAKMKWPHTYLRALPTPIRAGIRQYKELEADHILRPLPRGSEARSPWNPTPLGVIFQLKRDQSLYSTQELLEWVA